MTGTEIAADTIFENGVEGWTVTSTALTGGEWVIDDPIGTVNGAIPVQTENDQVGMGTICWFTGQGVVGGGNAAADVDGGPTTLTTPTYNVTANAPISLNYTAWVYNDDFGTSSADQLRIQSSTDGGATWTTVRSIGTTNSAWEGFSDVTVSPTGTMTIRFLASDNPNNSTFECALASFKLTVGICESAPACPADFDRDGSVTAADLASLLGAWGNPGGIQDLNGSGSVDAGDLAILLGEWGACR